MKLLVLIASFETRKIFIFVEFEQHTFICRFSKKHYLEDQSSYNINKTEGIPTKMTVITNCLSHKPINILPAPICQQAFSDFLIAFSASCLLKIFIQICTESSLRLKKYLSINVSLNLKPLKRSGKTTKTQIQGVNETVP